MSALAWTMKLIRPGSALQIVITSVLILAGVFFGVLLARSRAETGKVLLISGLILIASEILKEAFLYHLYGHYSWSDFPFQLCSIPMYFCVLYFFFRRRWIAQFTLIYSLIGAIASFMVPAASFSVYVLLTVHSLLWHTMLLLLGIFLLLRLPRDDWKLIHFLPVGVTYLILACLAVLLNSIFYSISGGTMNMFFLGPGWPDMIILNDIYLNSGWIPATLGMIGVSEAAGFAVYLAIRMYYFLKKS